MDVPVTEDAVHTLVTRILSDDHRRLASRTLQTATRFEREEDDLAGGSDE